MAEKKIIIIEAQTDEAEKDLNKVAESLKDIDKEADEANEEITELGKSAKKAAGGTKTLAGGFRKVGVAMKAMGIGLVIAAFAALSKLASENQVVMDKVAVAGNFLQQVFNDLVSFFSNDAMPVFDRVKKFFDELTFDKIVKAIKEDLIERFESLLEVLGFVGEAFKKLFEGDFEGALNSVKEAGKEMVDVMTGVDGSVEIVAEAVDNMVESVTSYTSSVLEAAEANIRLSKSSLVAAAEQAQLQKVFEIQAEQLRQIRDDESLSIQERIDANIKLGEVLEEQEEAMVRQADLQIAAAQAAFNLNQTDENRIALIEANTNKLDVLATVEGFRSEQLVNTNSLLRELHEEEEERADEKLEKEKERNEDRNKMAQDAKDRDREILDSKIMVVNAIAGLADQETAIGKAVVIAQQTLLIQKQLLDIKEISSSAKKALIKAQLEGAASGSSVAGGFAATLALGFPAAIPFLASYAVAAIGIVSSVITAVKAVKKTANQYGASGGSDGVTTPTAPTASAPNFNIVESNQNNNTAEALGDFGNQPIKAYVVSTEVTSQQELDRNTESSASVGSVR